MTLNVKSMLQLLSDELQHSTIRNVVKLLVDPAATCHFVPLFKSCVKVRSFERINSTALNVYFYHGQPKLIAFKLALCLPKIINTLFFFIRMKFNTFMISTLHNMKIYEDKPLSTEVRKLSEKDYLILSLPVVTVDMILENGTSCSIIVCIKKLSFLKKDEISSCEVGENQT